MKIVSRVNSSNDVVSRDFVNSYATTSGTNAYSITLVPTPTSLAFLTGQAIRVHVQSTSTGVISLNVNSLGAINVMLSDGTQANTWRSGSIYTVVYNGSNFIQQGEGGVVANGAVEKTVKYDETITMNDVIEAYYQDLDVSNALVKTDYTSPSGNVECCAWSPDGTFLAVGTNVSPYLLLYKRSQNTLTQMAAQTTASGVVSFISWSPDSTSFVVWTQSTSTNMYYYRRQLGDTFERFSLGTASLLSTFIEWSPSDEYIAVTTSASPFLRFYKRGATGFTAVTPVAGLTEAPSSFEWSPDGVYFLASFGTAGNFTLRLYKRSTGDTFTELTAARVTITTTNAINSIEWSSDNHIAVAGQKVTGTYANNLFIYSFSNETLTSLSLSSITTPSGNLMAAIWHPSNVYLFLGSTFDLSIRIIKKVGNVFSVLTQTVPGAGYFGTYSLSVTTDGKYIATASYNNNNSFFSFYQFASTTVAPYLFRKVTPATSTVGAFDKVYGIAKESGTAGQSNKKASILVNGNLV